MFSFSNKWVSLALTLAATLPLGISASAASDEAALVAALRDAPTAVDRINLLPDDEDFEFDFFDPTKAATVGAGGKIILANSGTFPAVIGSNSAMAVGILDACSMNTPHTHPRATEMQFSVNGTIRTGMITENNARFILTEIPPGSMTIFPQGSIHFQVNDGCEPLMFVSSFNSEDPGALQIAQRFLGLPPDIVGATFGGLGVVQVAGLESQIPDNVAIATDACLQRCGLTRPKQPTSQLQPIVSGNAFPSPTGGASYTYSTYNSGYQYNTKAASAAAGADYAYQTTTTTAKGNNYGNGNTYTTPKAQSYAMATATVSHGTSKWTTVYTSYAGSAYPTYAPSGPVNHLIKVGLNSTGGSALQFTPSNISAALGDTVTFEFHAKNHTVTQSSFPEPCKKLAETSTTGQIGFESGFVPVNETQTSNFPTFTITVNDTAPIWGYCGQQGPPIHCQSGMVFSINAVESGPNNFEAFKTLALDSGSQTLNGVTCPSADKDGSPLESAATSTDSDGNVFASCTYSSAGVCTFFSDGSFSSGSSTCPAGLPQASGFGTSPSSSGVNCPPTDKNGSALESAGRIPKARMYSLSAPTQALASARSSRTEAFPPAAAPALSVSPRLAASVPPPRPRPSRTPPAPPDTSPITSLRLPTAPPPAMASPPPR
ncbi:hypothetical protein K438DRAFT_1727633 [Mycena galopus ATCC 62051]|nr:hypothetical protein K438DRAFT_1727633 [Mycena galopus ATCC 62051]